MTLKLSEEPQKRLSGQGRLELEPIPSFRVPLVWDEIQDQIKEILTLNMDRISADDLYLELLSRRMQLWLVKRGRKILMVGVTVIRVYPNCKSANVIGISGTDMDSWLKFEPDLVTWARGEGCSGIDVVARKGWMRKLDGWRELGVVLSKQLGD